MATEQLYLQSIEAGYYTDFSATVSSVEGNKVSLDRTLFYPLGGGQNWDTGTLEGPNGICLLYTSPSPRDRQKSRMPSSA